MYDVSVHDGSILGVSSWLSVSYSVQIGSFGVISQLRIKVPVWVELFQITTQIMSIIETSIRRSETAAQCPVF
jgi:hypothetical protein